LGRTLVDNTHMVAHVVNVPFPAGLAQELEARAAKAGMSLQTYIAFLARVDIRRHDPAFVAAVQHLFKKYPESLRKLAE